MNKTTLEKLDLVFDAEFYDRCDQYIKLLQQWGKIHNLTASLKTEEIEQNIIDSIYPMRFLNQFDSLADIGTGAGYPGMLIAIANPTKKVVLIEPRAKRVAFLNFVKSALKLQNVEIVKDRVENINSEDFDIITSRAVSNTTLLLNLTKNISTEKTEYLFYKGSLCDQEIEDAKVKNYEIFKYGEHRNYLYIKREG
ncbi:MAG: 16S rRNA (guanine(527)-N(7))-methyltransferase RsmG [Campylobacterota bacterium]|nr:16S rRNA (guanine(527)-N(7))-methyltransferase RsmG [Campylobacterota bacterium]